MCSPLTLHVHPSKVSAPLSGKKPGGVQVPKDQASR